MKQSQNEALQTSQNKLAWLQSALDLAAQAARVAAMDENMLDHQPGCAADPS